MFEGDGEEGEVDIFSLLHIISNISAFIIKSVSSR